MSPNRPSLAANHRACSRASTWLRWSLSGLFFLVALGLALPAAAATYTIDPVHSSALFKVKHLGTANFYGMFAKVAGTLVYDQAKPGESKISVEIDAASVATRNDQRDAHAKSPDFLDVEQYPTIGFESEQVEDLGGGKLRVTGKLTLHGVTKVVVASVEKTGEGKNPRSGKALIGFEARITVDRTDFDMTFMAGPLSEAVEFILSVEAVAE